MRNRINLLITCVLALVIFIGLTSCTNDMQTNKAIDTTNLDLSTSPAQDFYQFANGGWLLANPLPEDRSRFGSFDELADRGDKQVKEIFEDLEKQNFEPGTNGRKIADFYASGMNTEQIEKDGFKGIDVYLNQIAQLHSSIDIQTFITRMFLDGMSPMFSIYADADSRNSEIVVAHLHQGGLGMPDRDYYLNDDERSVTVRNAYKKHVANMFVLIGKSEDQANEMMQQVMLMETSLAKISRSREDLRNPEENYNAYTIEEMMVAFPQLDWNLFFSRLGVVDPGKIIVGQPEFFTNACALLTQPDIAQWQSYLTWNIVHKNASYLSNKFVVENFDFYGRVLQGQPEMLPRWKRVLNVTSGSLDEAVGQLYVERFFPPEAKLRMVSLVENLKKSFGNRITNLDWMEAATKEKAIEKLKAMRVKVGYPDSWRSYEGLNIQPNSYIANVIAARRFDMKYMLAKINQPVDTLEWHMPPQMVNAYYSPNGNEIVFPAAILQPPFFFMDADDAVNYGAIGVVIGHEMTHGFDDQGRKYDKVGNLNNWWSDEDAKRFDQRTKVLVDQFNSFIVLDTIHANGSLSLGENIADLGGLFISYDAFLSTRDGTEKSIDGYTPEQRFFMAYAHVWGQNIRDEEILRRTKVDVHSLGVFRVNGPLPNMQAFHEAFDISEGDKMFLDVNDRAKIW